MSNNSAEWIGIANTLLSFWREYNIASGPALAVMEKAAAEGRDLTDAEVLEASDREDAARKRAEEALKSGEPGV